MAESACRPHEGGVSVHFVFVPRRAEVRPFGGGAARKGSVASLATGAGSPVVALIGVGVRSEQAASRQHCKRQEKENGDSGFSMANPDTVIHASTPPGYDFFPAHRPPLFNEITLISSSNEPLIEARTRDRNPTVAGSSNSFFAGVSFDNVTFISPPLSVVFCGNTTKTFDITAQSHLRCLHGTEDDVIDLGEQYDNVAMTMPIMITAYSILRGGGPRRPKHRSETTQITPR
jgi:hypothetical protein